jgi:hypothetical protein
MRAKSNAASRDAALGKWQRISDLRHQIPDGVQRISEQDCNQRENSAA